MLKITEKDARLNVRTKLWERKAEKRAAIIATKTGQDSPTKASLTKDGRREKKEERNRLEKPNYGKEVSGACNAYTNKEESDNHVSPIHARTPLVTAGRS